MFERLAQLLTGQATVRLDDLYHLHRMARSAHDLMAQSVGALGSRHRGWEPERVVLPAAKALPTGRRSNTLERCFALMALVALGMLVLVHHTFVSPFGQLEAVLSPGKGGLVALADRASSRLLGRA